jgi:ABC-2 type transport system permease protein
MKKKYNDLMALAILLIGILAVNLFVQAFFLRIDLTEEKRFSLSNPTKELLKNLDKRILIKVYLEGNFPPGFEKLQRETKQTLDEFRAYTDKIDYQFIDPSDQVDDKARQEVYQQLESKGLQPFNLEVSENGGSRRLQVFPGAVLSLGEREISLQILQSQMGRSAESQLNASIEKLEYTLASAIKKITQEKRPKIAFIEGHNELKARFIADLGRTLSEHYQVERFNLREFIKDSVTGELSVEQQIRRLNIFDALLIAKPQSAFSDLDRYLIDQFIMKGGTTLWFIDAVQAEMDSLSNRSEFLALPIDERLNLRDMLFKYGVRINADLVQDIVAAGVNDSKQVLPWIYSPLVMPYINHPITKDLNGIRLEFASSIDTIQTPGIKKTILLQSSQYSKKSNAPHLVSLARLYQEPQIEAFQEKGIPLGVLLEGSFESAYKNRVVPKNFNGVTLPLVEKSKPAQMLVISDGDIVKNQLNIVNPQLPKGLPLTTGYDQFTGMQYGNKDFLLNAFDYLLDESGLMELRGRELKIRLLDSQRVKSERSFWIGLNAALPIGIILLFAFFQIQMRKRRFAKKSA